MRKDGPRVLLLPIGMVTVEVPVLLYPKLATRLPLLSCVTQPGNGATFPGDAVGVSVAVGLVVGDGFGAGLAVGVGLCMPMAFIVAVAVGCKLPVEVAVVADVP